SPIVQYMEHLPYMTTLWLGEEADYDRKPDHWLVEHSGIPFGLTSEELFFSNNPNQYRGMVFGMGSRTYENANELWDFWYDYGMKDTEMTGYWQNPPVTSGCEDIPVTCYTKEKECLIAIASWSDKDEEISLHIDFERLGIDLKKAEITAPYIKGFQEETVFGIGEKIPVPKGKGWLLILK
ncbi:MAG: hypothetical protein KBT47_07830, partial [Armatimonadetes bacterium]|nr:hypothetical protein [Candidatus Hippobium faecium]